jgi:hypothetical protein
MLEQKEFDVRRGDRESFVLDHVFARVEDVAKAVVAEPKKDGW